MSLFDYYRYYYGLDDKSRPYLALPIIDPDRIYLTVGSTVSPIEQWFIGHLFPFDDQVIVDVGGAFTTNVGTLSGYFDMSHTRGQIARLTVKNRTFLVSIMPRKNYFYFDDKCRAHALIRFVDPHRIDLTVGNIRGDQIGYLFTGNLFPFDGPVTVDIDIACTTNVDTLYGYFDLSDQSLDRKAYCGV